MTVKNTKRGYGISRAMMSNPLCHATFSPDEGGSGGGDGPGEKAITQAEVSRMINGAMKNYGDRFDKKLEEMSTSMSNSFGEAIDGLKETLKPAEPDPGEAGKLPDDVQRLLDAQNAEIEKLKNENKKRDEALAAEQKKALIESERKTIQEALLAGGVDPKLATIATNHLHGEGLLEKTDDGYAWRNQGDDSVLKPYLSVDEGIKSFLGTEVGKAFMPPADAKGSNNRNRSGVVVDQHGNAQVSDEALDRFLITGKA